LKALSTKRMKEGQEQYFKHEIPFIGCSLWGARKVAKSVGRRLRGAGWTYDDVLALAEALLEKKTFEEKTVGLALVEEHERAFRKQDLRRFERWLRTHVTTWAHTDHIAPHLVAPLLERFPELNASVFKWTRARNRWVRRAAAVCYVIHGRRGRFHDEILRVAEALLEDEDDMVQKGVGWMLKEAAKADERAVVAFLMQRRDRAPRLVLRYATEKVGKRNRERVLGRR
jgi:3-methyladenine DNA glycosylase AlkD